MSRISSRSRSRTNAVSASAIDCPGAGRSSSAWAIAGATSSPSPTGASGTKQAPSAKSPSSRRAISSASRVLPVPPAPVSVSRRAPGRLEQLAQVLELAEAADERAGGGGKARPAAAGRRREVEGRVVLEDLPLERLELLAGLQPELLDEPAARRLERLERVGLATGAIQREHQLRREALPQRVLAERGREPADEVDVPAIGELALEPPFERGEAQLLEPCDLALRERLEGEVRERRAAPQRQRLLVALLPEQPLEAVQVELVVVDAERVAGRPRLQPIVVQQPPQAGDVAMQRGQRRRRRGLAPQRVDEDILRDDLVRPQQQHPEQRALAAAAESEDAAVLRHLQRAQDPEVDRSLLLSADATRQRPISDSLPALWIVACVHDKERSP